MNGGASGARHGLLLGCALAVGLIAAAYMACKTVERVKLAGQTLRVKGSAERKVSSDRVVWRAKCSARGKDLVAAYDKLQKDFSTICSYLERNGVKNGDMVTSPVATNVLYRKTDKGYATNEIEGYALEQSVELKSGDITLIERIARDSTSLIKDGIELTSFPPQYYYAGIEDLKIELLGEAMRDAKRRAEALALNSGSRVGPLRSASQGVFQITPEYSTEISDYGMYDTSSIRKNVRATVTVEFSIR